MKQCWLALLLILALAAGVVGAGPVGVTSAAPEATCRWTGAVSTAWADAGNWADCADVAPTPSDSVIIPIVTNQPLINSAVTVVNITIYPGSSLNVNSGGSLAIRGNLINNGTYNAAGFTTTFSGTTNQTVSGTGVNTFGTITVNNTGTSPNNVVEIATSSFSAPNPFLTLTAGILKVSGIFTLYNNNFFTGPSYTIPSGAGLWLNNSRVTVTAQDGSPQLAGYLRITSGTYNVGTSSGNSLQYVGSAGTFIMEGGNARIAGRFSGTGTTQIINFNMSGGTMTVGAIGNGATQGTFDIPAAGSSFTMSGGSIVLQTASTNGTPLDYRNVAGTTNITGGTVQFGNASTAGSPTFHIGAAAGPTNQLPSVLVNATGTPNVTPRADIVVNGNWMNNSTFTAGTNTVTFNGTSPQTIGGSSSTTFNNLTIANTNAAGVTVNSPTTVSGAFVINADSLLATGTALTLSGATRAVNGTLQINTNGWVSAAPTYGTSSTLIYNSGGSYNASAEWGSGGSVGSGVPQNVTVQNNTTLNVSNAHTVPGALTVASGSTIAFDNALAVNGTAQINGTARINSGGYFANSPVYGSSSLLVYNSGGIYNRRVEWNAASGAGYPRNVQISNNSILNPGGNSNQSTVFNLAGDLTIDAGSSLYLDYSTDDMSVPLRVGGNLALNGSLSLSEISNGDIYLAGNWTNNGTFTPNNRAVFFNGTGNQTIGGSSVTAFDYLFIQPNARVIFPATNIPTVANQMGVSTGATLTQTATINNSSFNFLTIGGTNGNQYRGVDVTSASNLGAVTVALKVVADGGCTTTGTSSPDYATRCYGITPTTSGAATIALWALDSERNNVAVANLAPYHYSDGTWTLLTNRSNGTNGSYVYATGDTTSFSPFLLGNAGDAPTAVTLSRLDAQPQSNAGGLSAGLLLGVVLLLFGWYMQRRRA